jgi:hypothetical protein
MTISKKCGRKQSWPNFSFNPGTILEEQDVICEKISQDTQTPGETKKVDLENRKEC